MKERPTSPIRGHANGYYQQVGDSPVRTSSN